MNNPDRVIGRKGRGDSRAHLTGRSPAGGEVRDIQCNALVLSRQRTDGQHPRNVDSGETGPGYELHRLFLALHWNRGCSVPSWGVQGGVPVAVRCQLPLDGGCPGADDPCAVSREVERGVRRAVARRCHQDDPEVDSQLYGGLKVGGTGPKPREAHADDLGWQPVGGYAVYGSSGGPHDSVRNVRCQALVAVAQHTHREQRGILSYATESRCLGPTQNGGHLSAVPALHAPTSCSRIGRVGVAGVSVGRQIRVGDKVVPPHVATEPRIQYSHGGVGRGPRQVVFVEPKPPPPEEVPLQCCFCN